MAECKSYDHEALDSIIESHIIQLQLPDSLLSGKKVLIKANLLNKSTPEQVSTTHPHYIEALARAFMKRGASVTVGDSPGGDFTVSHLKNVYRVCGYEEAASRTGFKLNYNIESVQKTLTDSGKGSKVYQIIKAVEEADLVVSAAKLKTHALMTYTGAVKNLLGTVPGLQKAQYHIKHPKKTDFADMLIDICELVKPSISFIDGIWAMEGNGPSGGRLRRMNVSIASCNPHAADLAAVTMMGLKINQVPTLAAAEARRLCPAYDELQILGESGISIKKFAVDDYLLPDSHMFSISNISGFLPRPLRALVLSGLKSYPEILKNKCIGCGECQRICPAKVIKIQNKIADINYKNCISCFCCHEMCPVKAIDIVKKPGKGHKPG